MYQIHDISNFEPEIYESLGTKSKFWIKDDNGTSLLFKSTRCLDGKGNEIERPGEDWAEKISCEIARELGIPHAHYELAIHENQIGVITNNFVPDGSNMILGNMLLSRFSEHEDSNNKIFLNKRILNRLSRVIVILSELVKKPPQNHQLPHGINSSLEVFCGYLLLDLLISNQDRHEENWGIIAHKSEGLYLAPTFDHAASLGRNENDEKRLRILNSKDIGYSLSTYIGKAKSQLYDRQDKRYKTVEAFSLASIFAARGALIWIEKLKKITFSRIDEIIDAIPSQRMTDIAKEFTKALIKENMNRAMQCEEFIRDHEKKSRTE